MRVYAPLAAAVALFVILAPGGSAAPPIVAGNPSLGLVQGSQIVPIPPGEPKIGDTIESTWAVFWCAPSCDPTNPDADPNVGRRVIHPSDSGPPAGYKMAWERCPTDEGVGCTVVRPASSAPGANRYQLTDPDSGLWIRSAVYATNLDCSEVVREGPEAGRQDCRWQTRGVYSKLLRIPPTIVVMPATLPDGQAGTPYSVPISAVNGTGEYAFGATGTLPPGLTFTRGAVWGTPTLAGVYTFTILAGGAGANPGSRTYTVRIRLGFATTRLAGGTTGVAYNQPLSTLAVGANGAVAWTLASGTLPPGLAIVNGALTGTPTERGTFTFTLQATDAAGNTGTSPAHTVEIVWPTLRADTARLPKAKRGLRYRAKLSISGGSAPYTVQLTGGRLPAGLRLTPGGVVAGKPLQRTRKTSFRFVVVATDRFGAATPLLFTLPYAGR